MNILIVHGWMHDVKCYDTFIEKLKSSIQCEVTFLKMRGFDNNLDCTDPINKYLRDLKHLLNVKHFDVIIVHSLGGYLLLKACDCVKENTKVILISPVYPSLRFKFVKYLPFSLTLHVFEILRNSKLGMFLLNVLSNLTVYDKADLPREVLNVIKNCNSKVTVNTLYSMLSPNAKPAFKTDDVLILYGEADLLVSKRDMIQLVSDLDRAALLTVEKKGHCLMFEDMHFVINLLVNV